MIDEKDGSAAFYHTLDEAYKCTAMPAMKIANGKFDIVLTVVKLILRCN